MPVFGPPPLLVAMETDDRFKETPSSGLMFIHLLGVFRPHANVHKETPVFPLEMALCPSKRADPSDRLFEVDSYVGRMLAAYANIAGSLCVFRQVFIMADHSTLRAFH